MTGYLHQHTEFRELLRILESETDIQAALIEKDYWIMHVLYGLKSQEYDFELKGGTSLSKGYKIIERFSEDIDIHIKLKQAVCDNDLVFGDHRLAALGNIDVFRIVPLLLK